VYPAADSAPLRGESHRAWASRLRRGAVSGLCASLVVRTEGVRASGKRTSRGVNRPTRTFRPQLAGPEHFQDCRNSWRAMKLHDPREDP